ncbi:S26 family signal peptidase [Lactobacillus sp. ESL0233]|uniref:S26 family signal peptidase n=1 Tax=Lactobacillus sp. ESL0233 TaxID=2069354 RepID=UPI003519D958
MTIITLGIFFLLLQFLISNNRVSGASMQPNFEDNDRLVTWRNFSSKHNDVVVLRAPKTT